MSKLPQGPVVIHADELGKAARKVLQKSAIVEIAFDLLRDASLGYPLKAHNGTVTEWWGQPTLDAWVIKHRLRPLPVTVNRGSVTFFST
jgi:hypothetical protein